MWDNVYDPNHIMKMRIQAAKQAGLGLHLNPLQTQLENRFALHQRNSDFQLNVVHNESSGNIFNSFIEKPTFQNYLTENRLNCHETHQHLGTLKLSRRSNPFVSGSITMIEATESNAGVMPLDSSNCDTHNAFIPRSQLERTATNNGCNNNCISIYISSGKDSEIPNDYQDLKPKAVSSKEHDEPSSTIKCSKHPKKTKNDKKWLKSYKQLLQYKNENGDCVVPRGHGSNPRLACWVAEQRKQYKLYIDGKHSPITPIRIQLLDDIGFAWNAHEAAWDKQLNDLRAYNDEYGDFLVPLMHPKYPKLGLWVKEQRRHFALLNEGRESHMTQERIQKLDSIGFCWDTHKSIWNERFRELLEFQDKYGHCAVPVNYPTNPKLGTWVHHQRRQYKLYRNGSSCHLTAERVQCLESVGFLWHARKRDCTKDESAQLLRAENHARQEEFSGKRQRLEVNEHRI